MSKHAASPVPLSTTVRATLADFKRTHADSWETDQKAFSAEQLADLQDLLTGSVRILFSSFLSGCLFLLTDTVPLLPSSSLQSYCESTDSARLTSPAVTDFDFLPSSLADA